MYIINFLLLITNIMQANIYKSEGGTHMFVFDLLFNDDNRVVIDNTHINDLISLDFEKAYIHMMKYSM